jgi:hypothetical protein
MLSMRPVDVIQCSRNSRERFIFKKKTFFHIICRCEYLLLQQVLHVHSPLYKTFKLKNIVNLAFFFICLLEGHLLVHLDRCFTGDLLSVINFVVNTLIVIIISQPRCTVMKCYLNCCVALKCFCFLTVH